MEIKSAEFVISSSTVNRCPPSDRPEYAFIGRSNVGKSSLLNMLTNRKQLAKTSSTPGKTQLINHFLINRAWYLVDLPGYGYAKVPKASREKWDKMGRNYLLKRENLYCVFVLIDSRIPPQKIDMEFTHWLGKKEVPFGLIFTKTDKLSKGKVASNIAAIKKSLLGLFEELPACFETSAVSGKGKQELLKYIDQIHKEENE